MIQFSLWVINNLCTAQIIIGNGEDYNHEIHN